ncbi:hypothetical protein CORC01_00834 [Colletotrichum orchidophilum]|uniref:Uncharacterized protein n=1 Tax=Colletotrichum orchidophilum TaxID=1209926 RepID=A0A1G4BRB5_9PEZI|nr:uncharacterized protein CORC01_00834 [Colletotrichum orchidophilum]OHF03972.1 hypothetical protein CORC01_00834 [Colletotrichum orchidophilum]
MSPTTEPSNPAEERLLSSRSSSYENDILEEIASKQALDNYPRGFQWRKVFQGIIYSLSGGFMVFLFPLAAYLLESRTKLSPVVPEWSITDNGQNFRAWEPSSACGNTPEKARAAGCIYDDVLLHWMPSRCSSPELIDEFEHVWPWKFFKDQNATQPITLAQVMEGTQDIKWVSMDLHRWHCVATWKILSSAARWKTTVPAYAINWNHSVHCADHVLINMHAEDPFAINSHLDIEYTPCVTLAEDKSLERAREW